jgi:nucleotide-binding universal stress UspA family protein
MDQIQRTLLVPLDGHVLAESALPLARLLASALGARLDLVQIVHGTSPATEEEEAREYLERVSSRFAAAEIDVSTKVLRGDPGDCIVREAAAEHVALVVIATHGRAGLHRAVRGSVAEYVVGHAPSPIVVVRSGLHRQPRLTTLLLPVDPSGGAPMAEVLALAQAADARVVLLTVVPPGSTFVWQWKAGELLDEPQAVVAARDRLEELATGMREAGVATDVRVAIGPPVSSIHAVAEAIDADLIVMSTHARTGLHRTMLGSTADSVVRSVERAVLLVRLPPPPLGRHLPVLPLSTET